jgi:hypothetical protein
MSQELQEHIDQVIDDLGYTIGFAKSHDRDVDDCGDKAVALLKLIPALFEKIRHGEPGHEEWLEEAIRNHFLGLPMPDYVAK